MAWMVQLRLISSNARGAVGEHGLCGQGKLRRKPLPRWVGGGGVPGGYLGTVQMTSSDQRRIGFLPKDLALPGQQARSSLHSIPQALS